ncbi:Pycsar system effector family protein [Streptosporangium lutulentum]|uniref:Pycsar effector protein domain-containing protein n=1 Tax=Streptosporangium lutulentum TaxID=1461250 RepID=A0ABT9QU62_9ACTN|nr:Pycsar system effector family protein [Streptosporangium lutulentum]MDP9850313.1 hypothetical protein [Streptosporangium lutulentum]
MTQPTIPSTARPRRWPTRSSRRGPVPLRTVGALEILTHESLTVRAELARIDAKAALLLSWAGGAFAVVAALGITGSANRPAAAMVGLWGAAALLATAVVVLLVAVRPRIPRTGGTGFIAHARADNGLALLAQLNLAEADRLAEVAAEVQLLSQIAVAKYATLRVAVDLLIAALVVLAIVLPLAKG